MLFSIVSMPSPPPLPSTSFTPQPRFRRRTQVTPSPHPIYSMEVSLSQHSMDHCTLTTVSSLPPPLSVSSMEVPDSPLLLVTDNSFSVTHPMATPSRVPHHSALRTLPTSSQTMRLQPPSHSRADSLVLVHRRLVTALLQEDSRSQERQPLRTPSSRVSPTHS